MVVIGVLGLALGGAQLVLSAMDLARRGELLRGSEDRGGRVDRREQGRERAALQGMLIASATLMIAAVAFLLAHQGYAPFESGQSAYHRQRAVAKVGVALAAITALSAGFGWVRWSQTRTWR